MTLDVHSVPTDQTIKLADIALINPRFVAELSSEDIISFVPMAALSAETAKVTAEDYRSYKAVATGYTSFRNGDILVAKITPCFENNKIGQANLSCAIGFGSTEFHVVRPDPLRADARYVMHFLRQDAVRVAGQRKMTGSAGQRRVPSHFLAGLDIPLPSLPEQRRIAAILDQADALRVKRRAALAQLDEMAQAIFVEMFGEPSISLRRWPVQPLCSAYLNEDSYRQPVKADDRAARPGPYAYYGASGQIDTFDAFIFEGERLLVGEDGANLLSRSTPIAFLVSGKYWVNNHAHVLAYNGVAHLRYLEMLFRCTDLSPFVSGSAQPKLTRSSLDRIPIPIPPIDLQNHYVGRIEHLDSLRTHERRHSEFSDALFASLQHRAFTGHL